MHFRLQVGPSLLTSTTPASPVRVSGSLKSMSRARTGASGLRAWTAGRIDRAAARGAKLLDCNVCIAATSVGESEHPMQHIACFMRLPNHLLAWPRDQPVITAVEHKLCKLLWVLQLA